MDLGAFGMLDRENRKATAGYAFVLPTICFCTFRVANSEWMASDVPTDNPVLNILQRFWGALCDQKLPGTF